MPGPSREVPQEGELCGTLIRSRHGEQLVRRVSHWRGAECVLRTLFPDVWGSLFRSVTNTEQGQKGLAGRKWKAEKSLAFRINILA